MFEGILLTGKNTETTHVEQNVNEKAPEQVKHVAATSLTSKNDEIAQLEKIRLTKQVFNKMAKVRRITKLEKALGLTDSIL